jgi:hypothetical protein
MARKAGNKWYVAGINGESISKELDLDLSFLKNKKGQLIASGSAIQDEPSFDCKDAALSGTGRLNIMLKGNDGFVIVFE